MTLNMINVVNKAIVALLSHRACRSSSKFDNSGSLQSFSSEIAQPRPARPCRFEDTRSSPLSFGDCTRHRRTLPESHGPFRSNGCRFRARRHFCSGQDLDLRVGKLCRSLEEEFAAHGIPEPRESAELLTAGIIGKPTLCGVKSDHTLTHCQYKKLRLMCDQRLMRKPIQYILGEWDFCELCLEMREPVFIPRPETEDLVNHISQQMEKASLEECRNVLEIGCGSGAVILALLSRFHQMRGVAVDQLSDACSLTGDNARLVGVADRLTVLKLDIDKVPRLSWPAPMGSKFDVIVSNPPYICTQDLTSLAPEIIRYEDHAALDGGTDGLDMVRIILGEAAHLLQPTGQLWLEVGLGQTDLVANLVTCHPQWRLRYLHTWPDFTQRARFCQLALLAG